MRTKLSINNLSQLDERLDLSVSKEMRKIADDLSQRPGDNSPRELSIKVTFTPQQNELGNCDAANVEFTINSKLPPRRSATYNVEVKGNGTLEFNGASPDNVNQRTLDEA